MGVALPDPKSLSLISAVAKRCRYAGRFSN